MITDDNTNVTAPYCAADPTDTATESTREGEDAPDTTTEAALVTVQGAAHGGAPATEDNVRDFTDTTQLVEDSHIVSNTGNTYNCILTDILLYLCTTSRIKLINVKPLLEAEWIDNGKDTINQREANRDFQAAY